MLAYFGWWLDQSLDVPTFCPICFPFHRRDAFIVVLFTMTMMRPKETMTQSIFQPILALNTPKIFETVATFHFIQSSRKRHLLLMSHRHHHDDFNGFQIHNKPHEILAMWTIAVQRRFDCCSRNNRKKTSNKSQWTFCQSKTTNTRRRWLRFDSVSLLYVMILCSTQIILIKYFYISREIFSCH